MVMEGEGHMVGPDVNGADAPPGDRAVEAVAPPANEPRTIVSTIVASPRELPGQSPAEPSALTTAALWGAMGLAFVGILGGLVLCVVLVLRGLTSTDTIIVRVLLSCVAIFVGTAFGALGFALFLIKAEGAFRARLVGGERRGFVDTTAPGLIVFLCATVIIFLSLHMQFSVSGDTPSRPASVRDVADDHGPLGGDMVAPTPLTAPAATAPAADAGAPENQP